MGIERIRVSIIKSENLTIIPSNPDRVEVFKGKYLLNCLAFFSVMNQQLVLTTVLATCGCKNRLIVLFINGGKFQCILIVSAKRKSLKQPYLPQASSPSASVSALVFTASFVSPASQLCPP